MYKCSLFLFTIMVSVIVGMMSLTATTGTNNLPVYAWIGCDGTAVTRTEAGKIVMTQIRKNMTNCIGPKSLTTSTDPLVTTGSISASLNMFDDSTPTTRPKINHKIILDLSQKDILNYRIEQIKQEQIRYANAIRSVRIRSGKSLDAHTNGYLIKNAAVQVTGSGTGWTPVKSGEVQVIDSRENTVSIDTSSGTTGYVGTRFLRNATPSDLVKIGQADIAYWTDLVHTNVSHLVNIRSNPWYQSSIVSTVVSDVDLYRVATVDNWSQVESIDGAIKGFIRSDFLLIDKAQLIEIKALLK